MNVLVHIGMHKTGTNWLQRNFFNGSQHKSFRYLISEAEAKVLFVAPACFHFDHEIVRRRLIEAYVESLNSCQCSVVSAERLCGHPHSGGYDAELIAQRLKASLSEARILLCFREQKNAALANYRQYVRSGGHLSIEYYLNSPRKPSDLRVPSFRLEYLDYYRIVEYYQNLFGAERVLAMPFEILVRDPDRFVNKICHFVGVEPVKDAHKLAPANVHDRASYLIVKNFLNRFFVSDSVNQFRGTFPRGKSFFRSMRSACDFLPRWLDQSIEARWRTIIAEIIGNRYRTSNVRLSRLLGGMDLSALGYDCDLVEAPRREASLRKKIVGNVALPS